MKVRELLDKLRDLDAESDVIVYTEEQDLLGPGMQLRVLDIDDVRPLIAERTRLKDNTPYLKLGKSHTSVRLAAICVVGDF